MCTEAWIYVPPSLAGDVRILLDEAVEFRRLMYLVGIGRQCIHKAGSHIDI